MKLRDLVQHLEANGCLFVREGANHTIYENPAAGLWSTLPRHREIKEWLVRKICKDLGIPAPR